MYKEQLLREILEFVERKGKLYFTKEELLIHLWYKYRNIKFESILRKLRKLKKEGFLVERKVECSEWGIGYAVLYYPLKNKIRAYLNSNTNTKTLF